MIAFCCGLDQHICPAVMVIRRRIAWSEHLRVRDADSTEPWRVSRLGSHLRPAGVQECAKMVMSARRPPTRADHIPRTQRIIPKTSTTCEGSLDESDTVSMMTNNKQTRVTSSSSYTWGGPLA